MQDESCHFSSNSHNRPEGLKQVAGLGPPSLLLQWVVRNFVVGRPAAEIISKLSALVIRGARRGGDLFIVQLPFFLTVTKINMHQRVKGVIDTEKNILKSNFMVKI